MNLRTYIWLRGTMINVTARNHHITYHTRPPQEDKSIILIKANSTKAILYLHHITSYAYPYHITSHHTHTISPHVSHHITSHHTRSYHTSHIPPHIIWYAYHLISYHVTQSHIHIHIHAQRSTPTSYSQPLLFKAYALRRLSLPSGLLSPGSQGF